jgi:hypothetical protein
METEKLVDSLFVFIIWELEITLFDFTDGKAMMRDASQFK